MRKDETMRGGNTGNTAVLLITLVLLSACAAPSIVCPDGSVVGSQEECPRAAEEYAPSEVHDVTDSEKIIDTEVDEVEPTLPEPAAEAAPMHNSALEELLSRPAKRVKSMAFLYAPIVKSDAGASVTTTYRYSLLGERGRADIKEVNGVVVDENFDTVFLDFAERSARAFCLEGIPHTCAEQGKEFPVRFDDYALTRPLDWLSELPASATITSEQMIEGRTAKVVEFSKDGMYYRYFIDSFTGVPLRVHLFADAERRELTGGVEYHDIAFNTVRAEDVTPPERQA